MWRWFSLKIYDLTLIVYELAALTMARFFHAGKAQKLISGRQNAFHLLESKVQEGAPYIWFHCASLGEFEQGRPLMERIRSNHPRYRLLLTFFSPSGFEVRKNYEGADIVCYLPRDSADNARKLIQLVQPKLALFVKYEFWYHYLTMLQHHQVPTLLISASFRSKQPFFKWYGTLWREMLQCYHHMFVQDAASLKLLNHIGISKADIANDTRFDRVHSIYLAAKEFKEIEIFLNQTPALIAGSTWKKDEEILVGYLKQTKPTERKFVIAPHNINEDGLTSLESRTFSNTIRYSELRKRNGVDRQVLIIDNIGMLSSIYAYGDIAYIGGGFGASVHNILEAAVYGIPVIFGPHHKKSVEALDLLAAGGAFEIKDEASLTAVMRQLEDDERRKAAGDICKKYVQDRLGGTDTILNYMKQEKLILNF